MTLALLVVAALLVGVLVGTVGVGGVFLAPALILIGGIEPHRAVALSLLSFALTGLVSVALHARDGGFPWVLVRNLGVGLLPGAFLGGWLGTRIPDRIILAALWLPLAGRSECGVRNAECGVGATNSEPGTPHSALRTPHLASLTIGRLHYDGGGDWYANPSSLPNLLTALRERTALQVAERERVVTLAGPELWDVPYIYMTGHGNVRFSDEELKILRRYLEQGGFLHADDNYGMDKSFRREIARVFPDHPLVEVPLSHPVYHLVYDFPRGIPKIHEHDGLPAQGFGVFLGDRLVVYYSYQSDLGDGWEDPDVHHDPPELHEAALRMGVNLFTYAVSSTR